VGANDLDEVADSVVSSRDRATTVRVVPICGSNSAYVVFDTADAQFKIGPFDAATANWLVEDYLDQPEWFVSG
jgi:hypothetical protein